MSDININICWWHHKSKGKIVASPNMRQGKTDGLLWAAGSACARYVGSGSTPAFVLTHWDANVTALLSSAHSFLIEWANWYLPFSCYIDDINPKQRDREALKGKSPGRKNPANCCLAQDIFSEMTLISIAWFTTWFSIPCLIRLSHTTRKQVS